MNLEAFAAKRREDQDTLETRLLPFVHDALEDIGQRDIYDELLAQVAKEYAAIFHSEGGVGTPDLGTFLDDAHKTLSKTDSDSEVTAERIAVWLATAILNAATLEATEADEGVFLEWVTMHDEDVRTAHQEAEGQQRPPGEPFDVGGEKMRFPGDPRGSVANWINCRCAARPATMAASLAAAADDSHDGICIVAIPVADDPAHSLSSEDPTHQTLVWLGSMEENPDLDLSAVRQEVALVARDAEPYTSGVTGITTLGDEGALVWMLDDAAVPLRQRLLGQASVKQGHEAVQQHPNFTPHTTIGYQVEQTDDLSEVKQITYDRLAVWDGTDKQEYALGGDNMDEMTAGPLPWYGVLAPEGEWSGDKRMFKEGSLRFRDLPLPLTWQKVSDDGHKGSVVVARIEQIARVGNEMRGMGSFLATPEADEAIGLIAEFGKFGVSVDADDAVFEFDEESGGLTFTDARIASASMVPIPAFSQAFVSLGDAPEGFMPKCDPDDPTCVEYTSEEIEAALIEAFNANVSTAAWDGSASRFTPEQWKKSCVLHLADTLNKSDHKLPIRDPGGEINAGGVHAAAGRFNQVQAPASAKAAAKAALRGAYRKLGEEIPEVLASAAVYEMGRGPGWVTNPEETRRLWAYWTQPGHEGYEKIAWGTPNDFYRCRDLVGQEIAENSPESLRFLNQICAQWHHDATGFWPGDAPSEQSLEGEAAPALALVATGFTAPSDWFRDPELSGPTPMQITDDGRVFGHIAAWGTCHMGYPGQCITPPHSASGYAYFLTGYVPTDEGNVPTGPLTLGNGHAKPGLSLRAAVAHYDNTTSAVCDVTCGEDEHGIWVAGWVRPGATDAQVAAMRASAPSGDWRETRPGEMEMVAALSVNTPGFPIPRVGIAAGQQVSLVAAGAIAEPEEMSEVEKLAVAIEEAMADRQSRRERMAALAARVGGE